MLKQLVGGLLLATVISSAKAYIDVQKLKLMSRDLKANLLMITRDSNERIKRIEDILLDRR